MSGWAQKRFWKAVEVTEVDGGYAVQLDGRSIKTPAKAALVLPTRALADLLAVEWAAQAEQINPATMPATRAANAAIDKVRGQFHEVAGLLTAYGETDLLCHRADAPAELVARQAAAWDPLLDWSGARFGVRWQVTTGVMPVVQPAETLERLGAHVASYTPFQLTAFHDLVAMPGSLVIGLAAAEGHAPIEALWQASRIDEDWQIEQWGLDDEAEALTVLRRQSFFDAARFFAASS
ncbi:MAG: ATPase [Rhodobacter sp.]|nr:ATPase [Paracoccaceae bacterium]MCC0078182.1 ATPase [Rhodobacter sp.]